MAQRENIILEVAVREGTGKGPAAQLRREGVIPGIVYKEGKGAVPVRVSGRDLSKILHSKAGANALLNLRFDGASAPKLKGHADLAKGEALALIKQIQIHPVTHKLVHVDFYQVSLTQRLTVTVPLAFKGESIGVKQQGGVLEHLRWDIELECLATEIPAEIAVEIEALEKGKTLHVKDLAVPAGVKVLSDGDQPVIACVEPKAEAAPAPAEGEAAPSEPEVIKQKKPEEGEEEAAPAAEGKKEKG